MLRLRRLVHSGKVFFVTTNLQRGKPPFTPEERDLMCAQIGAVCGRTQCRLCGFVVMPDHMHLLLSPLPGERISPLVQELKATTSRKLNAYRGGRGPVWQKGFFDRFMRTPKEFLETLAYIHQNPVRKGLIREPAAWRWSSAAAYAGRECILQVDFLDIPAQTEKRW